MSPYVYAGAFLCAAAIGLHIPSWLEARRSARRYDAASLAFWMSLTAYVDRAHADIDQATTNRIDARIESALLEGVDAHLTPLSDSEVAARIRKQMDENAAVRQLRADVDSWGVA